MSVQRRVFPESFKWEAVDRVANGGLSAGAVARELGLHETVLRRRMTAGDGDVAAIHNAGVVPGAVGFGRRGCPATAGERAASDGAGTEGRRVAATILRRAALIFGAAFR